MIGGNVASRTLFYLFVKFHFSTLHTMNIYGIFLTICYALLCQFSIFYPIFFSLFQSIISISSIWHSVQCSKYSNGALCLISIAVMQSHFFLVCQSIRSHFFNEAFFTINKYEFGQFSSDDTFSANVSSLSTQKKIKPISNNDITNATSRMLVDFRFRFMLQLATKIVLMATRPNTRYSICSSCFFLLFDGIQKIKTVYKCIEIVSFIHVKSSL